ncbi:hypothetical protein H9L13_05525 [Sphingomonas lutea]|uniref:Uncharacterized protein n=1 Tax=Sphingomonas lutea TaxID=1045317 RepID=A0A7G9SKE8_9SPHN|nr:hypothetical protein [Sphingomonas lutea]QNN68323.1 hypothetical protein H9L13_05525 [Sphingomonas lutea]
MDSFSFVFSLFGLLMGLALAEVISGLGTVIELRHKIRVGWLTPLLALLIAFDLTSFWMVAWQVREAVPVNFLSLMVGLLVFGIYYLIAQIVFPDDLDLWPDLDAYYWRHKRWLLGGMYTCNIVALAGQQAIGLDPFGAPKTMLALSAFSLGMAGAILLPGKRINIAFLLYQIALYPAFAIVGIMGA